MGANIRRQPRRTHIDLNSLIETLKLWRTCSTHHPRHTKARRLPRSWQMRCKLGIQKCAVYGFLYLLSDFLNLVVAKVVRRAKKNVVPQHAILRASTGIKADVSIKHPDLMDELGNIGLLWERGFCFFVNDKLYLRSWSILESAAVFIVQLTPKNNPSPRILPTNGWSSRYSCRRLRSRAPVLRTLETRSSSLITRCTSRAAAQATG